MLLMKHEGLEWVEDNYDLYSVNFPSLPPVDFKQTDSVPHKIHKFNKQAKQWQT